MKVRPIGDTQTSSLALRVKPDRRDVPDRRRFARGGRRGTDELAAPFQDGRVRAVEFLGDLLRAGSSGPVQGHRIAQAFPTLTTRICAEYREMRGLSLSLDQACRLWQINVDICRDILETLVADGFLGRTPAGRFVARESRKHPPARGVVPSRSGAWRVAVRSKQDAGHPRDSPHHPNGGAALDVSGKIQDADAARGRQSRIRQRLR
jgi:hypothetical protein